MTTVNAMTVNGTIATEPFKTQTVETKQVATGFNAIAQKTNELTPLKIHFCNGKYTEWQTIWVRSECFKEVWAKAVFVVDGKPTIFVPESQIIFVS